MKPFALVLGLSGLLLMSSAARAQEGTGAGTKGVEITPYVAMAGGGAGIGTAVRWPLAGDFSLEMEVGQRYNEITALSASLSLLYDLPALGIVTPYVAGGIGIEQYGYAANYFVIGPTGAPVQMTGTAATTAIAVNAGGGVRAPINETWGVRTDARYFNGLGRAPKRFRLYNGVTFKPGR